MGLMLIRAQTTSSQLNTTQLSGRLLLAPIKSQVLLRNGSFATARVSLAAALFCLTCG